MSILRVHKNDGESDWEDRIISFPFAHSVVDSLLPFCHDDRRSAFLSRSGSTSRGSTCQIRAFLPYTKKKLSSHIVNTRRSNGTASPPDGCEEGT